VKSARENAFTKRAVYLAFRTDCQPCPLREQCLASGAKGDRARSVSAVRRLLPPPAEVSRKPVVLGPMRWVDVAGRAFRRTWTAHWRRHYVEVIPLTVISEKTSPPPRPPRALRSHHRWSWQDRLACNAWWGPPDTDSYECGSPALLMIRRNTVCLLTNGGLLSTLVERLEQNREVRKNRQKSSHSSSTPNHQKYGRPMSVYFYVQ